MIFVICNKCMYIFESRKKITTKINEKKITGKKITGKKITIIFKNL